MLQVLGEGSEAPSLGHATSSGPSVQHLAAIAGILQSMNEVPHLSLVIPAYNEEESIPALLGRVEAALGQTGTTYEVIVVDDGSTDNTPRLLAEAMRCSPWLRVLRLERNCGKSAALDAGFKAARGRIIATIDADLQNDPEEIPRLLPMLEGWDMITGWRRERHDSRSRRMQTRIANSVRNWLSDETIQDSASSLKLYRRQCLEGLQLYTGMHRFLPTLVKMRGCRVREVPVKHSPRFAGTAKYGLRNRAWRAFVDLLAVRWMKKRYLRYEAREVEPAPDARAGGAAAERSIQAQDLASGQK
jgi:dolichol-phosphate mannosyltransferase